jgi:hypothetical protein
MPIPITRSVRPRKFGAPESGRRSIPTPNFTLISDGLEDLGYVTKELREDPEVIQSLHDTTAELPRDRRPAVYGSND